MGSCQMRPNCGHYDQQAARLNAFLAEGKDYDEVREGVSSRNSAVKPCWLPQSIGDSIGSHGWFRISPPLPSQASSSLHAAGRVGPFLRFAGDTGLDPALSARLDDELSNLD